METVAITGGAGGMGLATAKVMGRDHRVVLADVREQQLDAAVEELVGIGIEARGVVCDITDRAAVEGIFDAAEQPVRAVVHTAGVSPQMGSAERIWRINALGTIHVTEAFLARAGEGAALVNVASIAGHMAPRPLVAERRYELASTAPERFLAKAGRSLRLLPAKSRPGLAYALSKRYVIWYTQRMAAAFGAKGARIVSVSPGTFDTDMNRLEEQSGSGRLRDLTALKRVGSVEEIAELLAFCAGDRPGYLTGVDVLVDGGANATLNRRSKFAVNGRHGR